MAAVTCVRYPIFFFPLIRTTTGVVVRKAIIVSRDNELDSPEINAIDSMAVYWPALFFASYVWKTPIIRVGYGVVNTNFYERRIIGLRYSRTVCNSAQYRNVYRKPVRSNAPVSRTVCDEFK